MKWIVSTQQVVEADTPEEAAALARRTLREEPMEMDVSNMDVGFRWVVVLEPLVEEGLHRGANRV